MRHAASSPVKRPKLAPKGPRRWTIRIKAERLNPGISNAQVRRFAARILAELSGERLPPSVGELSILFVGDPAMRVLNRDYRGKDKPTDVLSFSQLEGMNGIPSPVLGDLVISVDTTKRQAKEYGVTYKQELLRLMVHGILHLHGYDHEGVSKSEAQRMRRREERILRTIGTGR
jgi:probable rRNA maturation factor